ncbi:DUF7331 family protein [Halorientalis sp.]|jgi:hypothetical protein|uniref:DUF7331 family protein n=1 Tax=Halorientalis sp. TaxID=1931229 RepID=UPI0026295331|nr:hypothetical protein [Halorientalis sp.]
MSHKPDTVDDAEPMAEPADDAPLIKSHNATDERTVFTEDGNTDGWIATDLTVECKE